MAEGALPISLRRKPETLEELRRKIAATDDQVLARDDIVRDAQSESQKAWNQGVAQLQAVPTSVTGLARNLIGPEGSGNADLEKSKAIVADASQYAPKVQSLSDIESAGDAGAWARNALLSNAAPIIPVLAAGAVATLAAPLVGVSGAIAGGAAAIGSASALQTNQMVEAALDTKTPGTARGRAAKAVLGALGTGALDALPQIKLLRRFGLGDNIAKEAAEAVAKPVATTLAGRIAKNVLEQGAFEGSTEAIQSVGEHLTHKWVNDNIDVMSNEALAEYMNSFAAGALVGGVLGGPAGFRDPNRVARVKGVEKNLRAGTVLPSTEAKDVGAGPTAGGPAPPGGERAAPGTQMPSSEAVETKTEVAPATSGPAALFTDISDKLTKSEAPSAPAASFAPEGENVPAGASSPAELFEEARATLDKVRSETDADESLESEYQEFVKWTDTPGASMPMVEGDLRENGAPNGRQLFSQEAARELEGSLGLPKWEALATTALFHSGAKVSPEALIAGAEYLSSGNYTDSKALGEYMGALGDKNLRWQMHFAADQMREMNARVEDKGSKTLPEDGKIDPSVALKRAAPTSVDPLDVTTKQGTLKNQALLDAKPVSETLTAKEFGKLFDQDTPETATKPGSILVTNSAGSPRRMKLPAMMYQASQMSGESVGVNPAQDVRAVIAALGMAQAKNYTVDPAQITAGLHIYNKTVPDETRPGTFLKQPVLLTPAQANQIRAGLEAKTDAVNLARVQTRPVPKPLAPLSAETEANAATGISRGLRAINRDAAQRQKNEGAESDARPDGLLELRARARSPVMEPRVEAPGMGTLRKANKAGETLAKTVESLGRSNRTAPPGASITLVERATYTLNQMRLRLKLRDQLEGNYKGRDVAVREIVELEDQLATYQKAKTDYDADAKLDTPTTAQTSASRKPRMSGKLIPAEAIDTAAVEKGVKGQTAAYYGQARRALNVLNRVLGRAEYLNPTEREMFDTLTAARAGTFDQALTTLDPVKAKSYRNALAALTSFLERATDSDGTVQQAEEFGAVIATIDRKALNARTLDKNLSGFERAQARDVRMALQKLAKGEALEFVDRINLYDEAGVEMPDEVRTNDRWSSRQGEEGTKTTVVRQEAGSIDPKTGGVVRPAEITATKRLAKIETEAAKPKAEGKSIPNPMLENKRSRTKPAPKPTVKLKLTRLASLLKNATRNTFWGAAEDPIAADILTSKDYAELEAKLYSLGILPTGVLGAGASSIVIDTNKGAVRIGRGELATPPRSAFILRPKLSGVVGALRYEVYAKADTAGITDTDVETVRTGLAEQGIQLSDAGTDNLGRVNGQLVVIDPGAVKEAPLEALPVGAKAKLVKKEAPAKTEKTRSETDVDTPANETFYSALLSAVKSAKNILQTGTPQQWKDWLNGAINRGEFKTAERDWVGIDQWLAKRPGKATREAVIKYIKDNQLQVDDVILGAPEDIRAAEQARQAERQERIEDLMRRRRERERAYYATYGYSEPYYEDDYDFDDYDFDDYYNQHDTLFEEYQIPGGKNYRVILMMLPAALSGENFQSVHWSQSNVLVHVRFNERVVDGKKTLFIEEIQSDWHQKGRAEGYGTKDGAPDAPFKAADEWAMLAYKRMVRHAAENGFERIAWTTGKTQNERYPAGGEQQEKIAKGMGGFYDTILPTAVKNWAKRLGGTVGMAEIETEAAVEGNAHPAVTEPVHSMDVTPEMRKVALGGQVTFGKDRSETDVDDLAAGDGKNTPSTIEREQALLDGVAKVMGTEGVTLKAAENGQVEVGTYNPNTKTITMGTKRNGAARLDTLLHEFGHHIISTTWKALPKETRSAIIKDYKEWLKKARSGNKTWNEVRAGRSTSFISRLLSARNSGDVSYRSMSVEKRIHLLSVNEYLADQLARAMGKNMTTRGVISRYFTELARQLRELYAAMTDTKYQPSANAETWVQDMLNAERAKIVNGARSIEDQHAALAEAAPGIPVEPPGTTAANAADGASPSGLFWMLSKRDRAVMERGLGNFANRTTIKAAHPEHEARLDRYGYDAATLIDLGTVMWLNGDLTLNHNLRSVYRNLVNVVKIVLGMRTDRELAQKILQDYKDGIIKPGKYDGNLRAYRDATKIGQVMNNVARKFEDKVMPTFDKLTMDAGNRLRGSQVPALRRLASLIDPLSGEQTKDIGLVQRTQRRFVEQVTPLQEAVAHLSPTEKKILVRALQRGRRPTPSASRPNDPARDVPKLAAAYDAVMKEYQRLYDFARAEGIKLPKRANYFPLEVDTDKIRNDLEGFTQAITIEDPRAEEAIRLLFKETNEFGEEVPNMTDPLPLLIGRLAEMAATSDQRHIGEVDFTIGQYAPAFKNKNPRVMGFMDAFATPAEKAKFAKYLASDLDMINVSYVRRLTKRTEFQKVFDKGGKKIAELLDDAVREGATPEDIQQAVDLVNITMGSYKAELNPKIKWVFSKLDGVFDTKLAEMPIEQWAHYQRVAGTYQNLRLLALAALSSFTDPLGIYARSGDFAGSVLAYREAIKAMGKDSPSDLRAMAERLHVIQPLVLSDSLAASAGGLQDSGSRLGRINNMLFRLNGLEGITRYSRMAAVSMAHQFLIKHRSGKGELSERYLKELGLSPSDIQINPNQPSFVVLNDRTEKALYRFVEESVLRPKGSQRPNWHNDPNFIFAAQYRGFLYSFYNTVIKRLSHEVANGNAKAVVGPIIGYMAVTMAAELMRETIRYGIDGNPNREKWDISDYFWLSLMRSGLTGPRAQVLTDARGDVNRGNVLINNSWYGPSGQQLISISKVVVGRNDLSDEIINAMPGQIIYGARLKELTKEN